MPASAVHRAEKNPPFTEKYAVERVLGRGGMGTVFEARHVRLGQRVAIKVLGEELRVHPELVQRFEREARAAGALSSPHACRIFDIDQTDDGTPFIVMELLSGCDLARLLDRDGPQPIGCSTRWVIEACDAIAEAHQLGIVHRDIKPSNLHLCESGAIKVLDFGIAKRVAAKEAAITQGLAPLGTPQYMSPEQVRCAKDVDGRSDIWSLGVTLFELLTGRPPFDHEVPQACIAAIAADPVPDPREFRADLPADLALVILRALAKDPKERYQTVDELVAALTPFTAQAGHPELPSWKTVTGARRAFGTEDTTLGDAEVDAGEEVPFPLRPPHAVREDDSFPPAVSRVSVPSRGRRVRSSLAVVGAAVLGLAALVATPQCVGARLEQAAASRTSVVAPVAPVEAKAATPAMVFPSSTVTASGAATIELSDGDESPASVAAEAPPAIDTSARPSVAKPVAVKPLPRPVSSGPVRVIGSERPVHGGISNPGF